MKVAISADRCIGGGQCVVAAAEVFDLGEDDGIVILLDENPPAELDEKVREAAMLCPAAAIHLSEA